jgi:hypothetical protein
MSELPSLGCEWFIFLFRMNARVAILFITSKLNRSFPRSWLTTRFITSVTRRMPIVEQDMLTHSKHMSSLPVSSRVRAARSLVFWVVFCRSLFYVPNTICMHWVCIQWMAWKYISNYYCHWPQTATKLNLFGNCIWFDEHVVRRVRR